MEEKEMPVVQVETTTETGIVRVDGVRHLYDENNFEKVSGKVEIGGLLFNKGVVYRTKEYTFFSRVQGNRLIGDSKLSQMIASFLKIGVQPGCPVFVYRNSDGTHAVIGDGQTRVQAAMALNEWIYFVISDRISLYLIIKLNSTSRNWSTPDFIDSYSELGITDYKVLREALTVYPSIGYKHVTKILLGSTDLSTSNSCSQLVRAGEFKLGEYSEKLLEYIASIIDVWDKLKVVSSRDCFISAIRFMWIYNHTPELQRSHGPMDPEILMNHLTVFGQKAFSTFCDVEGAVIALDSLYVSTGKIPVARARFLQCAYDTYIHNQEEEKRKEKNSKSREWYANMSEEDRKKRNQKRAEAARETKKREGHTCKPRIKLTDEERAERKKARNKKYYDAHREQLLAQRRKHKDIEEEDAIALAREAADRIAKIVAEQQ